MAREALTRAKCFVEAGPLQTGDHGGLSQDAVNVIIFYCLTSKPGKVRRSEGLAWDQLEACTRPAAVGRPRLVLGPGGRAGPRLSLALERGSLGVDWG